MSTNTPLINFDSVESFIKQNGFKPEQEDFLAEILENLVANKTVSSLNPKIMDSSIPIMDYVGNLLKNYGFEVEYTNQFPFPEDSEKMHKSVKAIFYPKNYDKNNRNTDILVFSSHLDRVPEGAEAWKTNPFKLTKEEGEKGNNVYFARGIFDMLGHTSSALTAMIMMLDEISKSDKPVAFLGSCLEEVGVKGVTPFRNITSDMQGKVGTIVVTEPSGGFIGTGSKGIVAHDITKKGIAENQNHKDSILLNIEIAGGHTAILGAPVEPSVIMTRIYEAVKVLREKNINIEVSEIKMGESINTASPKSSIKLGITGSDIDKQIAQQELQQAILEIDKKSKKELKLLNATLGVIFNTKFKSAEIDLNILNGEQSKKSEKGHNALENLLDGIKEFNEYKFSIKNNKAYEAKGYGPFGKIGGGILMINGDVEQANTKTGIRTTSKIPNDMIDKKALEIFKGSEIKTIIDVPPLEGKEKDKKLANDVLNTIKQLGIKSEKPAINSVSDFFKSIKQGIVKSLLLRDKILNLPFGSDGSVLREIFPEAKIIVVGQGSLENGAHSKNEYMTSKQLFDDTRVYLKLIADHIGVEKANKPDASNVMIEQTNKFKNLFKNIANAFAR